MILYHDRWFQKRLNEVLKKWVSYFYCKKEKISSISCYDLMIWSFLLTVVVLKHGKHTWMHAWFWTCERILHMTMIILKNPLVEILPQQVFCITFFTIVTFIIPFSYKSVSLYGKRATSTPLFLQEQLTVQDSYLAFWGNCRFVLVIRNSRDVTFTHFPIKGI